MEISEVRPLSDAERALTRWMLEQGGADAHPYIAQLEAAHVVSRCPCGCASISFEVTGMPRPTGGMRILADFLADAPEGAIGIFVFAQNGVLGGIEVVGYGCENPSVLPPIAGLRLV